MNIQKICWLAGLWDGEGSITIFYHSGKFKPQLCLTNTNVEIINEAVKILDELEINMHIVEYSRPKSKKIYQLTTSKLSNLIKFCDIFTQHLIGKKSQAELLKRYALSRLKKRENTTSWGQNTKYDDDEIKMEKDMRILNRRGESSETIRLTPNGDDIVRSHTKV